MGNHAAIITELVDVAELNKKETLDRFMDNEALYMKFLVKFLEDDTYDKLVASIEADDHELSLLCVHTLKGLASNLGLAGLSVIASEMTDRFKINDVKGAREFMDALDKQYKTVCEVIGRIEL